MPGAVPRTSTFALTNATLPYVRALADHGWKVALERDPGLAGGLNVQGGKIVATGPGLPMPSPDSFSDEPWTATERQTRFVPMQARTGDYALFFRKAAVEITFEGDRYLVVPQAAILALVREE